MSLALEAPPADNLGRITFGRAFLPLLHFTDPFLMVESPRGCLKTISILNVLMQRAAQWPGHRWYIWRSTRELLSTTVLPSYESYVIPAWKDVPGMRLMNPAARPGQRSEYIFENGSVFLPIGMDDVLRGTSAEGAGGYLAEAIELPNREAAVALLGMMREPGVPFHQIIMDVNPGPPGHWSNTSAEPISPDLRRVNSKSDYIRLQRYNQTPAVEPLQLWKRIVARIQDNPFYWDTETWSMTEIGRQYIAGLGLITGPLYQRWVLGEWALAEGSVFREFDERHVCPPFPAGWPPDWPLYLAEDPGYDHPTAICIAGVAPNGRLYIIDEYVRRQTSVEDDAAWITAWEKSHPAIIRTKYGDPHYMFSRNKHNSGDPVSEQMRRLGHSFVPAPAASNTAELNAQVQMMRTLLTTNLSDGLPAMQFWNTCPMMITAMQSWEFARSAKGEVQGAEDKYREEFKDEMDACRMIVVTRPVFEESAPVETEDGWRRR